MPIATQSRLLFIAACAATSLSQAASFATFGTGSIAYDVSADGKTVAGIFGSMNFLWTPAGFTNPTGGIAPGSPGSGGQSQISADGKTLLAAAINPLTSKIEPALYNVSMGTWTLLGSNGGYSGSNSGSAYDMTPDGRYVAGASYATTVASSFHATIWDTRTMTHVDIGGGVQSRLDAISNDGAVAVGYTGTGKAGSIWRRQADGSYLQSTLFKPDVNAALLNETTAISSNGLWAAGASFANALPYFYNVSTGAATYFDKLAFADGRGRSTALPSFISGDGKTIIGTHSIQGTLDTNHGFVWTAGKGVVDLDQYLEGFGIDSGNNFNFVSPITTKLLTDGSMSILGIAKDNRSGGMVGFMVNVPAPVPEPSTYAMLAAGLSLLGFSRWRGARRA